MQGRYKIPRCNVKERRLGALDGQEQKLLCDISGEGRNPEKEDVRGGRAPFSGSRTLGLRTSVST